MKKILNRIFIEGLSGMACGLFATLIIGTIIQQIGNLVGGNWGTLIYQFGKFASAMTSAGIGVGVACRFKESPLVVLSAATAGNRLLCGNRTVPPDRRENKAGYYIGPYGGDLWRISCGNLGRPSYQPPDE